MSVLYHCELLLFMMISSAFYNERDTLSRFVSSRVLFLVVAMLVFACGSYPVLANEWVKWRH